VSTAVGGGSEYRFVAWTRSGIGALLEGTERTFTLDLGVHGQVPKPLAAYAPADVEGIDPRAIRGAAIARALGRLAARALHR